MNAPASPQADPETREALERLAATRVDLAAWIGTMRQPAAGGVWGFQPRSATMRALLALGQQRLPWMRWAFSAFVLLRSWRRRRR